MKQTFFNIARWLRRYIHVPLIACIAFLIFVVYFNDNSYARSAELAAEIEQLRAGIKENNDTLAHYRALIKSLSTDPAEMERIVRENYHFQRPDEDVYICR